MDKVRIGFVGTGSMGQMAHLVNYVNIDECEVVALAEIRPKLRERIAKRYEVPKTYADHNEMFAAESLDAVVASQPFTRHATLLPEIFPKVKYLFTEKPLAVSVAAAEKLVADGKAAGCTHMVGYHKRSDPATLYARQLIDRWKAEGTYGPLKYVRIIMPAGDWEAAGRTNLLRSDEPLGELQYEADQTGMPTEARNQYTRFVNYYIHQVNLMRHLLAEPYQVSFAEPSGVLMAVQSESGVAGTIEMSPYRTTIAWEESALIAFEKAYIRLSLPAPLARNRAGRVEVYTDPGEGATPQRVVPTLPWVHAMRQQAINFVAVCRGELAPPCDAAEAAEDLKIARDYIVMREGLSL